MLLACVLRVCVCAARAAGSQHTAARTRRIGARDEEEDDAGGVEVQEHAGVEAVADAEVQRLHVGHVF